VACSLGLIDRSLLRKIVGAARGPISLVNGSIRCFHYPGMLCEMSIVRALEPTAPPDDGRA
jgi:hypothetical protein